MSILVYRDQAAASAAAATLIAAQIIEKPDSVLGLSAGRRGVLEFGKVM